MFLIIQFIHDTTVCYFHSKCSYYIGATGSSGFLKKNVHITIGFMILHRFAKSSRLEKLPLADLTKSETQFREVHTVFPYRSIDPI